MINLHWSARSMAAAVAWVAICQGPLFADPNPERPVIAAGKPVKVFILAGQSNMQGHAHIRTINSLALDPKTAPLLKEMLNADGSPKVCDRVWISSIGSNEGEDIGKLTAGFGPKREKIGPEFTFGITMEKLLDEPIVIIKTAWGGRSLHTDFRPPSAGPYVFNETQLENFKKKGKGLDEAKADKAKATGAAYREMIDHVRKTLKDLKRVYPQYDAEAGYQLAGFVWFQGWNDMVDAGVYPNRDKAAGYDDYSKVLTHFIRDIRKDLNAPKLPFVIGVMGVGGPTDKFTEDQKRSKGLQDNFRKAMAAPASMPEFQGNVVNVFTENYWDLEVTALKNKEKSIKAKLDDINAQAKAGKLKKDAATKEIDALYAATFTPRELKLLKESVSNAEFHYMGSAKILGQIGKAFAEALAPLCRAPGSVLNRRDAEDETGLRLTAK